MSRVKGYPPTWVLAALTVGLLVLITLALGGCADPPPIVAVSPTATMFIPKPTPIPTPTPRPTFATPDFPLPAPSLDMVGPASTKSCVICHTRPGFLKAGAGEGTVYVSLTKEETWKGAQPSLDAWEKVYLDNDAFFGTVHGRYGCTTCHGGQGDSVFKEEAHQGLVRDPAATEACGDCHADEVAWQQTSLHAGLNGFETALAARSTPDKMTQLQEMADNHCRTCHTSCGQCHVSRPTYAGGGLLDGHKFASSPPVDLTCSGCHGNRVDREYKGKGSAQGDVHWTQARMECSTCHPDAELHGAMTTESTHRYDNPPIPSCLSLKCHPDVGTGDGIEQHDDTHLGAMSCQTCHSTAYVNCSGCHVTVKNDIPSYELESSQIAFKIGLNPLLGFNRPWKYVPLRHVPITRDSFAYYGSGLLPNFDALPTWKYATPHNIQRVTPQNESCNACHGNTDLFLTVGDVPYDERKANEDVIVKSVPEAVP